MKYMTAQEILEDLPVSQILEFSALYVVERDYSFHGRIIKKHTVVCVGKDGFYFCNYYPKYKGDDPKLWVVEYSAIWQEFYKPVQRQDFISRKLWDGMRFVHDSMIENGHRIRKNDLPENRRITTSSLNYNDVCDVVRRKKCSCRPPESKRYGEQQLTMLEAIISHTRIPTRHTSYNDNIGY